MTADKRFHYDLFLSFSSRDGSFAAALRDRLLASGLSVFFSEETLASELGSAFLMKRQARLETSRDFLLVASEAAMSSDWVNEEWTAFYQEIYMKDRDARRFFILFVPGYDKSQLPILLRLLQLPGSVDDVIRVVGRGLTGSAAYLRNVGAFEQNLLDLLGRYRSDRVDDTLTRRHLGFGMNEILNDANVAEKYQVISSVERQLQELEAPSAELLMRRLADRLDSLRRVGRTPEAKALYELGRRRLDASWSREQLDRLGRAVRAIFDWQDVYLSYTNRNARIVNDKNLRWIKSTISGRDFEAGRDTTNLAAQVVRYHLRSNNLGMSDEDHSFAFEDVKNALRARVSHSATLIQLLQPESFIFGGAENWMFEEYQWFVSQRELGDPRVELHFPMLLDVTLKDLEPAVLPYEYAAWWNHIQSVRHVVLPTSQPHECVSALTDVARAIVNRQRAMLGKVLQPPG